jgi:hypothetical protein
MPDGNAMQTRVIADQVAEATILKLRSDHPELLKPEIPAPLKWAGGIVAALFVMGIGATATWLVSTTNETQLTVGRIDERIKYMVENQDRRFTALERRVDRIEDEGSRE